MASKKNDTNNVLVQEEQFFADISKILHGGRNTAYYAVNSIMVKTYWHMGRRIVEQEQHGKARANYGEQLIVNLLRYLTDCFGKGFSVATIRNIRQFYLRFSNFDQFTTQCVANLSWTHLRLIMHLDDEKERLYYLQEANQQHWTTRLLERNINSGYFRRLLSSQNQKQEPVASVSGNLTKQQPSDLIKDPYILEFLDVPDNLTGKESLLESSIIEHLQKFLLELGKGFSFIARQMRISC